MFLPLFSLPFCLSGCLLMHIDAICNCLEHIQPVFSSSHTSESEYSPFFSQHIFVLLPYTFPSKQTLELHKNISCHYHPLLLNHHSSRNRDGKNHTLHHHLAVPLLLPLLQQVHHQEQDHLF